MTEILLHCTTLAFGSRGVVCDTRGEPVDRMDRKIAPPIMRMLPLWHSTMIPKFFNCTNGSDITSHSVMSM
jgi:hypothetical protein